MRYWLRRIKLACTMILALQIAGYAAHSSVCLVYDDHLKEWCAYANESAWKSKVDSTEAAIVATLNYSNSALTSVDVTTEDEAGDWMVFDHYTLSRLGTLERLERKANILPGRRSVSESYELSDGKAKRTKRETSDLKTGEKLTDSETWLPDVRIALRVNDFQFVSLARLKYSDILSKGKVCARTRHGAP